MRIILPVTDKITFKGHPLEIHVTYSRPKHGTFEVRGNIPLPSDYHSPFAEKIRREMKTPILGYVLFEINRSLDMPIYLARIYIFSNMLRYEADRSEVTPGLGKYLLCTVLRYMASQRWMRPFIESSEDKIHLIAGGGQCDDDASLVKDMSFQDCLKILLNHPLSLQTLIELLWVEREWTAEEIVENIMDSDAITVQDIKDRVLYYGENAVVEEEDEQLQSIHDASNIIQFFNGYTEIMINYLLEQDNIYDDIEPTVRMDVCKIVDNMELVKYYQRYKFVVEDMSDGMSVPMTARLSDLVEACQPKTEGSRRKRRGSKNSHRKNK